MFYARTEILLKLNEEVAVRRKEICAYSMRVYCPTRKENTTLDTETKEEDQTKERVCMEGLGVDRRVTVYQIVSGTHVIQDMDLWQAVVNTIMNNRFLQDAENILTC